MPIYSPPGLNTSVRRYWNELIVEQGNPLRTVITTQFPFNVVWEQNPPQVADRVFWPNIRILPGLYTLRMIYIDGPSSTDEINIFFRAQGETNFVNYTPLSSIIMFNPPVAEAVEFVNTNVTIPNSIGDIVLESNVLSSGFTAGNIFSLEREN